MISIWKKNSCFFQLECESEETVLHMGDEWYFFCSLSAFLCPFLLIKTILSLNFTSNFSAFIVFFKYLPFKKPSEALLSYSSIDLFTEEKSKKPCILIHPSNQPRQEASLISRGHLRFKVLLGDF